MQVAEDYEQEKIVNDKKFSQQLEAKDKKIAEVKAEKQKVEAMCLELKDKVYKEQESFARLNETYVILQH